MYNPIWFQPEAKFIDINAFPKIEASETFNFWYEWCGWLVVSLSDTLNECVRLYVQ